MQNKNVVFAIVVYMRSSNFVRLSPTYGSTITTLHSTTSGALHLFIPGPAASRQSDYHPLLIVCYGFVDLDFCCF